MVASTTTMVDTSVIESVERIRTADPGNMLERIKGRADEAASRGEPVRRDDNPEVFKTRLDVYREQTAPVTEQSRSQGLLNIVDGLQPMEVVTEEPAAALAALPSPSGQG